MLDNLDQPSKSDTAAKWMRVLPTVSAYVRSIIYDYYDSQVVIRDTAIAFFRGVANRKPDVDVMNWSLGIARQKIVDHCLAREERSTRLQPLAQESSAVDIISGCRKGL